MCTMYRGENIVLMIDEGVAKKLGDKTLGKLEVVVEMFRKWTDKLRLDRDARVKIIYRETDKDDSDDVGTKMEVDDSSAHYN